MVLFVLLFGDFGRVRSLFKRKDQEDV